MEIRKTGDLRREIVGGERKHQVGCAEWLVRLYLHRGNARRGKESGRRE